VRKLFYKAWISWGMRERWRRDDWILSRTAIMVWFLLYPSSLALDLSSILPASSGSSNVEHLLLLIGETEIDLEQQDQHLRTTWRQKGRKLTPKAGYTKRLGGCVLEILSRALTSLESSLINFMFSSIRDGVTDLGMTELPRATVSRISYTLASPSRDQKCRRLCVSYRDNSTTPHQEKHHVSWPPLEYPFPQTTAIRYFPEDYTQ
jgi:hypothetical protein